MKIKNMRMFATETGSEKQIEIDEITVLASPESMAVIGQFFKYIQRYEREWYPTRAFTRLFRRFFLRRLS